MIIEFKLLQNIYKTVADGSQIHIAWGATCGCHNNVWELGKKKKAVCKKWVSIGPDGSDACRMRCKVWLMRGLEIEKKDELGRHRHIWEDCDKIDPWEYGSEEEIDALASETHLL